MARLPAIVWPVCFGAGMVLCAAAFGQEALTWDALQGAVIEARIVRDQVVLRGNRHIPVRFEQDIEIVIGPGDTIQVTSTATSHGPAGTRRGQRQVSSHTLERPRGTRYQGSGHGVWVFDDGTLTFLRTFKDGAIRRTIAIARAKAGLTCTANDGFAREDGVGSVVLDSAVGTGEVAVLSAKQISSSCRIAIKK